MPWKISERKVGGTLRKAQATLEVTVCVHYSSQLLITEYRGEMYLIKIRGEGVF